MVGLPGQERSLTIFLAVWIQRTSVTDRQTDRYRPTASTALMHSVARSETATCLAVLSRTRACPTDGENYCREYARIMPRFAIALRGENEFAAEQTRCCWITRVRNTSCWPQRASHPASHAHHQRHWSVTTDRSWIVLYTVYSKIRPV